MQKTYQKEKSPLTQFSIRTAHRRFAKLKKLVKNYFYNIYIRNFPDGCYVEVIPKNMYHFPSYVSDIVLYKPRWYQASFQERFLKEMKKTFSILLKLEDEMKYNLKCWDIIKDEIRKNDAFSVLTKIDGETDAERDNRIGGTEGLG